MIKCDTQTPQVHVDPKLLAPNMTQNRFLVHVRMLKKGLVRFSMLTHFDFTTLETFLSLRAESPQCNSENNYVQWCISLCVLNPVQSATGLQGLKPADFSCYFMIV